MLPEERSVLESIDAGINVHMPQGYYYGKPVDDAAMTAILRKAGHGGHGVLEQTASAAPTYLTTTRSPRLARTT